MSASDDGHVTVWELGAIEHRWRTCHEGVATVAVSPDGIVVSGGRNGDLQLWDANSGAHRAGPWRQHNDRIWSVCLSPDGECIASCSADGTFIIWDAHSLPAGRVIRGPIQTGLGAVRAIAYCPLGRRLATSGHDSTIKIWVWDDDTGDLQATLLRQTDTTPSSEYETVPSVSWTKDGNNVISGSADGTVRMWDVSKREMMWEISAHADAIHCIAVSQHVFATAAADHTISVWNLQTRDLVDPFPINLASSTGRHDEAHCVVLTADENALIASTKNGEIFTIDIGDIIPDMKVVSPSPSILMGLTHSRSL